MPSNVEIKARVRDLTELISRAAAMSDSGVVVLRQVDTFFFVESGRLKLREQSAGPAQLIYYERPDRHGPKRSDYHIFETDKAAILKSVLGRAIGIRGQVEKIRSLYQVGQTRVHIDRVEGLGNFMELEVVLQPGQTEGFGREVAAQLMQRLGVTLDELLEESYMDLLERET